MGVPHVRLAEVAAGINASVRTITHRYGRSFTFQWHITHACRYNCKHCYGHYGEKKSTESLRSLHPSINELLKVLGSIEKFYSLLEKDLRQPVKKNIILTGGDPLLHPDFLPLVDSILSKNYTLGILGCPETFTESIVDSLKGKKLSSIQFSLDGTSEYHDVFRNSPGSFKRTLEKAKELQEYFPINIMYTVCKENMQYFKAIVEILSEEGIKYIDFARVAHSGKAKNFELIPPIEYAAFLNNIYSIEEKLISSGSKLRIGKKDNLWKLFYYQKGLLEIPEKKHKIISGCPCGFTSFSIFPQGEMHLCSRFDSPLGTIPKDDIYSIYHKHAILTKYQNPMKIEGCSICKLKYICRGCPATASSYYGKIFRRDPQCWSIEIQ